MIHGDLDHQICIAINDAANATERAVRLMETIAIAKRDKYRDAHNTLIDIKRALSIALGGIQAAADHVDTDSQAGV